MGLCNSQLNNEIKPPVQTAGNAINNTNARSEPETQMQQQIGCNKQQFEGKEEINEDLYDDQPCNHKYSECASAVNIKSVLQKYFLLINDKTIPTDDLPHEIDELIEKKMLNGKYSNIKLVNDFYHLKYNHDMNNNANEFDSFYQFVVMSNENIISCDINCCKGYKRYHRNREQIIKEPVHAYSYNLVSRIHTFFLHSYETNRLTGDEITTIENQLNQVEQSAEDGEAKHIKLSLVSQILNKKKSVTLCESHSKYITSEQELILDYRAICKILNENQISVTEKQFEVQFDNYSYTKEQLINDLCDAVTDHDVNSNNTLTQILLNILGNKPMEELERIYHVILYQYVNKEELNTDNFTKILVETVSELYDYIDLKEIQTICMKAKINGKIFDKSTKEYKNSGKFANVFKGMNNWKRKHWGKVYTAIKNKWEIKKHAPMVSALSEKKINMKQKKHKNKSIHYLDPECVIDEDVLKLFCAITSAKSVVAEPFLIDSNWNIDDAVNKYYALNGVVSKLGAKYENYCDDTKNEQDETIYNEGIKFWYWKPRNNDEQQCYIERNYDSLKEEIVMGKLSLHLWNELEKECAILINVDKIKQIVSNGKNEDVYGISAGDPITLQHIYAIKLYTDFTALNWRFCEAFRLKKLTTNAYERIQSLKKRNKMFAVWAKLLIECVQCYGKLGSPNKKYYRGVSQQFMFRKFLARYYVPLSTTKNFQVAVGFTQETGMVMELKKYNNYVSSFACSMLSDFDNEKETLFFGEGTILRINSLYMYDSGWQNFKHYVDAIEQILNIVNGSISWSQTNNMKHVIGSILPKLYNNCTPLPQYIESLLKYHLQHLPYQIEYDFSELAHSHQWVKDIFVKNNEENIPNVCNMCNLFENCDHISITMSDSLTNFIFNSFCESVITDIFNVINKNVTIEFRFSSMNIPLELDAVFQKYSQQHVNLILHTKVDDTAITICPIYVNSPPEEITLDEDEVKRNPIWRSNEDRTVARWQNRLVDGYLRIQQQDIFSVESRYSAYYNLHVVAVVIYKFYNPFLTYPYPETSTVVVVGNYGTGKSSFVKALIGDKHLETNAIKPRENPSVTSSTDNELQLDEPNLIVEAQTIHFGGEQLRIVDTAARDVMGTQQQMQEADIVIVLLNASSNKSIEDFDEYWIEQFNDISL
eukprot:53200_1